MAVETDIAIIGGGPGGYVGAIRAAQLGARTVLIEKSELGGTCLNRGCVPSKALLESARRYVALRHAGEFGLRTDAVGFDFSAIQARKRRVVDQLRTGVEGLIKGNGITLLRGTAKLVSPQRIAVELADGGSQEVQAAHVIIATGSIEARPPITGLDLPGVFGSDQGLELSEVPGSVIVIGGGAIGVEFATLFNAFGAQVTIIEMLPGLLPLEDAEIGRALGQQFQRRGIQVRTGSKVEEIREAATGGLEVATSNANGSETLRAERVMIAIGRRAYTAGLGLEPLGITLDHGLISVDDRMRTSVPGVFAIGDVAGGALAHVASAQGEVAVENALERDIRMDYRAVPSTTFCEPSVASVGLTEEKARAEHPNLKIGRFPFVATSKAVVEGETTGFVKIVAESQYGQVLGVHLIGAGATDLIAEATLAIAMEATLEDLIQTIHAHPTLPEALREASLDADARVIHLLKRRRSN